MSDLQQYGLKFNAQAIHAKEFRKRFFRGYDRMEVDEYLDEIIQDYTHFHPVITARRKRSAVASSCKRWSTRSTPIFCTTRWIPSTCWRESIKIRS